MNVSAKDRDQLRKLHALLGSENDHEHAAAREKIRNILLKYKLSWNDLAELIQPQNDQQPQDVAPDPDLDPLSTNDTLDVIRALLEQYVQLSSPHEYVAITLWIVVAHEYRRFAISPRLALLSPFRGSGKTELLKLIERLLPRARRTDNITPAAIFHTIDQEGCAMLIDEGDNLGLQRNGVLRSVLNSSHGKGGGIDRVIGGQPRHFSTFAPIAIAAIGDLPLPLRARAIVINMRRADGTRKLRSLKVPDPTIGVGYQMIWQWWQTNPTINPAPEMPPEWRNRRLDNWQPLIAVADAFGPDWGRAARDAAAALNDEIEDIGVVLLGDIRDVFDATGTQVISSAVLVSALNDLDDGPWSAWRGIHDNRPPRPFSQHDLAAMLRPVGIRPRTIWLSGGPQRNARKGYRREWFEGVWAAYCPETGTPAQSSGIKHLRGT